MYQILSRCLNITGASFAAIKLEIDDTIGQERFRSLAKIFFKMSLISVSL